MMSCFKTFRRAPLWALDHKGAIDVSPDTGHPLAAGPGEPASDYMVRMTALALASPATLSELDDAALRPGGLILCGPMCDDNARLLQAWLTGQGWTFAGLLPLDMIQAWPCAYAWGVKDRGGVEGCPARYMASSWGFCCVCWEAMPLDEQRRIARTGVRGSHWNGKNGGWAAHEAKQAGIDALARARKIRVAEAS